MIAAIRRLGLWLPLILMIGGSHAASSGDPVDTSNKARELKQIQRQIEEKSRQLKQQQQQQQQLTQALQQAEQQVAKAAAALHQTTQAQQQNREKQQQLTQRQQQLTQQQQQQEKVLGQQLASAYMAGRHDLAQLLLNQQQSSKMERLLGYYEFLTQARVEALDKLKETLTELEQVNAELAHSREQLKQLAGQQRQHQQQLRSDQQQRQQTLGKLHEQYRDNSEALEKMQLSEAEIKNILQEASNRARQLQAMGGLDDLKGQLEWPTDGRLSNHFGRIRQGQLRWKGVLIRGQEGQPIKAVQHGQILFSDWIKGFGLVLVVDHGEGYMSLYGHNQALLKQAGEMVARNDVISLLGRSGGQTQAGLYFEIRHKGRAVNPAKWFRK